tara:strand:- start:816 stop:1271 length:456 start_codon:yes stop_codon:yes gene_type:complete
MNLFNNILDTNQNVDINNYKHDALKGNFLKNCLNDVFFSNENVDALQTGMRNMVANKTNGKHIIKRQSDDELKIIMRAIYYQYGLNQTDNILEQVQDLNKKVLEYCVKRILIEIEQYNQYIKDASEMHVPIERSVNLSNKGNKTLYRETLF